MIYQLSLVDQAICDMGSVIPCTLSQNDGLTFLASNNNLIYTLIIGILKYWCSLWFLTIVFVLKFNIYTYISKYVIILFLKLF